MAMLAEPRQRKRYNLVPRGKALYEDDSRFGTKMLEKMGWEKGKGLGAKEDGSKDFVRIRYKNDILGLGFEHRDDQWTQHEQSFNGLLKTLNNEDDDANMKEDNNGNESEGEGMPRMGFGFQDTSVEVKKPKVEKLKEKISGISLEERSKQSKARVHYKKFTRGKDLAQYSEKDLANIFGKKAADDQTAANDFYSQLSSSFKKKAEESKEDEENANEGVQIINTGVSVNDYFKTKMEAIKKRKNGLDSEEIEVNVKTELNEEQQEGEDATNKKKKKKSKKEKKEEQLEDEDNQEKEKNESRDGLMIYSNMSVTDYFKMKMQAIKNKNNGVNSEEKTMETPLADNNEAEPEVIKKKKKNKKELKDQENEQDNEVLIIKEKKSKKNKTIQDQETENNEEMVKEVEVPKKKEKKSKQTNAVDMVDLLLTEDTNAKKKDKTKKKSQEEIELPIEEIDLTIKKSKKRKHEIASEESTILPETAEGTTEEPTKKKKNKKTKQINEIVEIVDSDCEEKSLEENEKEKKSKKSNESSEKESSSSTANQTANAIDPQPSEKPPKVKRKDVSEKTTAFITDIQTLRLDELKTKYQAFNIYPISSFCAEKFRNISLNDFTGSVLPQIEGYGLDSNLQLDVQINKNDEERITNLWKGVLNKYVQLEKPKKTYQHYIKEAIKARKQNQKRPKLYVKTWQRKNAFQII